MALESFFDANTWNVLSEYEKERYQNIYNNYLEMLELGIDFPKPDFLNKENRSKITDTHTSETRPPVKKKINRKRKSKDQNVSNTTEDYEKLEKIFKEIAEKGFKYSEFLFSKKIFESLRDVVIELEQNVERLTKNCEKKHYLTVVNTLIHSNVLPEDGKRRYPKRNIKKVNYTEYEIPEDYFIYCDRCQREWEGCFCPFHGPLLNCHDTKIPVNPSDSTRAMRTVPDGWLAIRKSGIPDAGYGVWTIRPIPVGVRFGPYEGKQSRVGNDRGYCWEIRKEGQVCHYIDGKNEGVSNWMRYVNCARNIAEQNVAAFQFLGNMYYRTIKDINAHTELLVWYGEDFAKQLGINIKEYNVPSKNLKKYGFECSMCKLNFSSPVFLEQHKLRCKKSRSSMCAVNTNGSKTIISKMIEVKDGATSKENVKNSSTGTKTTEQAQNITNQGNRCEIANNSSKENCNIHKNNLTCKICSKSFSTSGNLKIHMQGVHEQLKPYQCTYCDKSFIHSSHLKTHIRGVHEQLKPYQCTHCDKSFTQSGNLKKHIQSVHEQLKSYQCTYCDKSFTYSSHLKTHIRGVHEQLKPYQCTYCDKSFTQSADLKRHIQSVHEQLKPYQCTYCDKSFTLSGSLKKHIQSVHEQLKPYQCTYCHKSFTQSSNLKTHIRTIHATTEQ